MRTAYTKRHELHITADFNSTTPIEIIGAPRSVRKLYINGRKISHEVDKNGIWKAIVKYEKPKINLPNLKKLDWKYVNTLPELQDSYDDSAWTTADLTGTNNPRELDTPTSLYAGDYGYHAGYLLYRGHFIADGSEETLLLGTQGGTAYSSSVWLNGNYLGSWRGTNSASSNNATYTLTSLSADKHYILTVLIDTTGVDANWNVGADEMKAPRGILNYELSGREKDAITWKLTGNLGGEDYADRVRGPRNEGGLFVERQGWHQPEPPSQSWGSVNPVTEGVSGVGVGYFTTSFDLDIPKGWDVPLYLTITNNTETPAPYRVQLYVNGYQFGKYISNIGPQTKFPIPEGILDYHGTNWLGITLWSLDKDGAKVEDLSLEFGTPVLTGLREVELVKMPAYKKRKAAY